MLNHNPYHQHLRQQNITAYVQIFKSSNGKISRQSSPNRLGMASVPVTMDLCHNKQHKLQHQNICYASSDVTARQTRICTTRCTCKKHNIECTPACSNCRGSGGCINSSIFEDEEDSIDDDDFSDIDYVLNVLT